MSGLTILIVSGSRTLATREGGEAWARGQIVAALADLAEGGMLVAGDASGPDAWAINEAHARRIDWRRFGLDGHVCGPAGHLGSWAMPADLETDPRRRPLQRNDNMVRYYHEEATTLVLGLVDPQSRTKGTDHTLRMAHKAGLRTERRAYP